MTLVPEDVRINVSASFPTQVLGANGITVAKQNGIYTVKVDYPSLAQIGAVAQPAQKVIEVYDNVTGIYNRMPLTALPTGGPALGVTDGSDAPPGYVGEYLSARGTVGSIPNSGPTNIVSLSLTPGDWDVWGAAVFSSPNPSTTTIGLLAASLATSVAIDTSSEDAFSEISCNNTNYFTIANVPNLRAGHKRWNVTTSTIIYLNVYNTQSGSSPVVNCSGKITARRRR